MEASGIEAILITDCGSTTTKAILIEKEGEGYRQTFRAESPTTVESPVEDITAGIINAFEKLSSKSGRKILDPSGALIRPSRGRIGVDLYLSTCSAGGGLQLLVAGLVGRISTESARRAALGAGAIVADAISCDDDRPPHEQIWRIGAMRPDVILLAGGVEGGANSQVLELAKRLAAANPSPRFGESKELPLVFAGNSQAARDVERILMDKFCVHGVSNLRPAIDEESVHEARDEIQRVFLDHVMGKAPGFQGLAGLVDAPVLPTPRAVGDMVQDLARIGDRSMLLADLGGATTDIFTVVEGAFKRTVSANMGLSYSAAEVFFECGAAAIARWLPFEIEESTLMNAVLGKTIRPTTIPDSHEDLLIEQALAREAVRKAAEQHFGEEWALAGAKAVGDNGSFGVSRKGYFKRSIRDIDLIIASGGGLSHAPKDWQTAAIVVDALEPEGVTVLAVDSFFMMPHLGVLLGRMREVAREVCERDCLGYLGTCVAPRGRSGLGKKCLGFELATEDGRVVERGDLAVGELRVVPMSHECFIRASLHPVRGFDVGNGKGKAWNGTIRGGKVGIILDGRGRPLNMSGPSKQHRKNVGNWLDAYETEGVREGEAVG